MLTELRRARILELLRRDVVVTVGVLAEQFEASPSTIRRDLEEMEQRGELRRVHGGAMRNPSSQANAPSVDLQRVLRQAAKEQIGREAAHMVQDGDTIFVDGGTTTAYLITHLAGRHDLTVVTCGLSVINALVGAPHILTIAVGGELHVESQTFVGRLAVEALEAYNIRCNTAFISAAGVTAADGITVRVLDRIPMKRKAMEVSVQTVVLADGSKVGVTKLGLIAPIGKIQCLVTDAAAPADELRRIADAGVKVVVADADYAAQSPAST